MTVNEKIAKWLGWIPDGDGWCLAPGEGLCKGRMFFESMEFDTDAELWHGENGLLAKISEQGKVFVNSFLHCYFNGLFGEGWWHWDFNPHSADDPMALLTIMDSAPAQLAVALAQVIDEEFAEED